MFSLGLSLLLGDNPLQTIRLVYYIFELVSQNTPIHLALGGRLCGGGGGGGEETLNKVTNRFRIAIIIQKQCK